MKKQSDPNKYELEDEYDLAQMAGLPKGRYDQKRGAREESSGAAINLTTFMNSVAETVRGDERVLLAYVFGSGARGDAGPMSDLDLAVLLTHAAPVASLRAELAGAFYPISGGNPVDLVILNEAPVELAYAVICEGKVLYERSFAERVEYEADVLSRYWDWMAFQKALEKG